MARIVWRDGSVSSNLNNQEEKQDSGKPPSFFCALQAYGEVETLQIEPSKGLKKITSQFTLTLLASVAIKPWKAITCVGSHSIDTGSSIETICQKKQM